MRNKNLKFFIFGALTYQIFFIFFKNVFFDRAESFFSPTENLKIVRKDIQCPNAPIKLREKRSAETPEPSALEDKLVTLEPVVSPEQSTEHALKRSRVKFYLIEPYDARNITKWSWYDKKPFLESGICKCNRNEIYGKAFNYKEMFEEKKEENQIRKKQYENFLRDNRFTEMAYPLIRRTPFNHIEITSFGVTLQPYESVILPVKFHLKETEMIKVDLDCHFCDFPLHPGGRWRNVTETNRLMTKVRYMVEVFDARQLTDIVTVTLFRQLTGEIQTAEIPGKI